MKKIRLTNDAHLEGYEGSFYRFTTDEGEASAFGIWGERYEATAIDDNGTEYRVVWAIANREAFDNGDEDCCIWNAPNEITNIATGSVSEELVSENNAIMMYNPTLKE